MLSHFKNKELYNALTGQCFKIQFTHTDLNSCIVCHDIKHIHFCST